MNDENMYPGGQIGTRPEAPDKERFTQTLPTDYFDRIYDKDIDPWQFETSDYEREKYRATLDSLPRPHYRRALEIGCSIGVFTQALAARCDAVLAVDLAARALERARERCVGQPHAEFRLMRIPETLPDGEFDLILVSEVGYYWSAGDLDRVLEFAAERLPSGGTLELVHWIISKHDYPQTGDEVHERAITCTAFRLLRDERPVPYRLTVLERV